MSESPAMDAFIASLPRGNVERPPATLRSAQIEELTIIAGEADLPASFVRGNFVRFRHRRGRVTADSQKRLVFMFWRYLDPADPADQKRIDLLDDGDLASIDRPDCIIVWAQSETVTFITEDSHALVRDVDPAREEGL